MYFSALLPELNAIEIFYDFGESKGAGFSGEGGC